MKLVITILSTLLVGFVAAQTDECYASVESYCTNPIANKQADLNCNSKLGHFSHVESKLRDYTYDQLASSYDYILLSTLFSSYAKDRPGFAKVFRELSDKAFDNSIKLIKQVTRRGGEVNFASLHNVPRAQKTLELDELHALATALDIEKKLSEQVMSYHAEVSSHAHHDPETTQFLEEEFLEDQIKTIRKLSGHINDLQKIMLGGVANGQAPLGVYLFDEYLQKH